MIGRVSDSNAGGTPPQNPYGGQGPAGQNPYGQPSPTGEQPYGHPPAGNPYGAPSPAQPPYGQPQQGSPYLQPAHGTPYAGGPLGDGLDMYGRPLGNDERPGTITAAAWTTMVFSGLTALLFAFFTLALVVSKDDFLAEVNQVLLEQGTTEFDAEDAYGIVLAVMLVLTAWCVIALFLGIFAMRRSNAARIMLVISASIAGLLSLAAIGSVVSVVWLLACLAVVILLFTGGANDWYARRRRI